MAWLAWSLGFKNPQGSLPPPQQGPDSLWLLLLVLHLALGLIALAESAKEKELGTPFQVEPTSSC